MVYEFWRISGSISCLMVIFVFSLGCGYQAAECECTGKLEDGNLCIVSEEELPDAEFSEGGQWQSADWTDESWLCFGPRMRLKVTHPLDYVPTSILVYLSFYVPDQNTESSFLASGDLARIVDVAEDSVIIENKTNEFFSLRLVLE